LVTVSGTDHPAGTPEFSHCFVFGIDES
jgi:hypothetical protein